MISASKVALASACGFWLTAPLPVEEESAASAEGTRVHTLIEHDDGESPTDEPAVLTARRYIASIGNRPMEREVAYGWDGTTGYRLGIGRAAYGTRDDLLLAGTADLVTNLGPGRWRVTDWKNGERGTYNAEAQLRVLAALLMSSAPHMVESVEMHAVWLQGDGTPVDYGTISVMEADGELATARALGPTEPRPGDHCSERYCPLVGRCPAFTEAAGLVPVTALTQRRNPLVTGVQSAEDAIVALPLLDMVEERVKAVREEMREWIRANGGQLALPDGRVYGPSKITRKGGVKADLAFALAERMGASKEDLAACIGTGSTYERWDTKGKKSA